MTKPFFEQVYDVVRQIPPGKVTTYGDIAKALGSKDARKIGWALHSNPYPPSDKVSEGPSEESVPCHRVVNKQGRLAPNFAFDGPEEQYRRLEAEGVVFNEHGMVDMKQCLWIPN